VAATIERFGQLDALVNNAGVTMWARFEDVSDLTAYREIMAVNYLGAVHLTAAALPHLRRSRGQIVAVASVAGLTGVPERTAYAASKHAMVGFFESLRIELAGSGVSVTLVAPDFVHSDLHGRALGPDGPPRRGAPPRTHGITAEACAWQILQGMQRRRRLVITSLRGRLGRWARLLAPALVDRIAARAVRTRR
jgi:short-subunit dehydrogenase